MALIILPGNHPNLKQFLRNSVNACTKKKNIEKPFILLISGAL